MPRIKSFARKASTRQPFVSSAARQRYTDIFAARDIHMEKGFLLGNATPSYLPDYVTNVIATRGWVTFAQHPAGVNVSLVRDFYSNYEEREEDVVSVREFLVDVSAERINALFGLEPAEDQYVLTCAQLNESLFGTILSTIGITGAQWAMTPQGKHRLPRASLNAPAKVWYHFMATRLLPTSQGNMVQEDRAILLYCILAGLSFNVGRLIAQELEDCAGRRKVRAIPASVGGRISDSVEQFFTEHHPSTYLSHTVVYRTSKLQGLINDAKNIGSRLIRLQSDPTQNKYNRGSCFGWFGRKVDLVDHYEKRLGDIEQNLKLRQSEVSLAGEEIPAAFVSFKSRYGAAIAMHMQQSNNPIHWVTEQAPEPDDVYWPFFSSTFLRRWISKLGVVVACFLLTVLFFIPVVVVQGLANLQKLQTWFPFLKSILTITFISQIITGYLPSLILQLFLKMVPPIMECLSSIQGYISRSDIEKSACFKVLWFTIWNIFFATVFSGTAIYQISMVFEPKKIPEKLAVVVPAQASFFIAYVVTSGWTSSLSELTNLFHLIHSLVTKLFSGNSGDEQEVPAIRYHSDIPRILFFGLLGVTYFFQAPLILPFLLIYFSLEYIIYRNQFINVYASKYETAGKFWPIAHNSIIFSLLLTHAIAVGIFTLKKHPRASTLLVPLPIFTLLFNDYCRKRFLPNFVAYSAECLIKKDREDENNATMAEFLDKLVTAYRDPALKPVQFTSNVSSLNRPLISSADD